MYGSAGKRAKRPFSVPRFVNIEQVRVLVQHLSFSLPEAEVYQFPAYEGSHKKSVCAHTCCSQDAQKYAPTFTSWEGALGWPFSPSCDRWAWH